jgi:hypothetical protein
MSNTLRRHHLLAERLMSVRVHGVHNETSKNTTNMMQREEPVHTQERLGTYHNTEVNTPLRRCQQQEVTKSQHYPGEHKQDGSRNAVAGAAARFMHRTQHTKMGLQDKRTRAHMAKHVGHTHARTLTLRR